MKREGIVVELVERYLMTSCTAEPTTLNKLATALGGNRAVFYRVMRAALADPTSGLVFVIELRRQRGGARRVWTLRQAVDARLPFELGGKTYA